MLHTSNQIFSALSEPRRFEIVELLAKKGRLNSTDISKRFEVTPAAISQHLKVLKEAEVVIMRKLAQQRLYEINPDALDQVEDWAANIKTMWLDRFNRLERLLNTQEGTA